MITTSTITSSLGALEKMNVPGNIGCTYSLFSRLLRQCFQQEGELRWLVGLGALFDRDGGLQRGFGVFQDSLLMLLLLARRGVERTTGVLACRSAFSQSCVFLNSFAVLHLSLVLRVNSVSQVSVVLDSFTARRNFVALESSVVPHYSCSLYQSPNLSRPIILHAG